MKPLKAIKDKEEYYRALVALNREIEAKCHALYLRRVEHQEKVIETMFSRMATDPCGPRIEMPKRRRGASRLEERDDWPKKQDKARAYLHLVEKGVAVRIAAHRVGIPLSTIYGWLKRMGEISMDYE